jgi:hypothetical protein
MTINFAEFLGLISTIGQVIFSDLIADYYREVLFEYEFFYNRAVVGDS